MKTELTIKLTNDDCLKIYNDLIDIRKRTGLNAATYLLFNKIKGMCCAYSDIEVQ